MIDILNELGNFKKKIFTLWSGYTLLILCISISKSTYQMLLFLNLKNISWNKEKSTSWNWLIPLDVQFIWLDEKWKLGKSKDIFNYQCTRNVGIGFVTSVIFVLLLKIHTYYYTYMHDMSVQKDRTRKKTNRCGKKYPKIVALTVYSYFRSKWCRSPV